MKKTVLLFVVVFPFLLAAQNRYPDTKKQDLVENYHGTQVPEPYRWLEDDNSEETKAWVNAQNKATEEYLATIPYREQVRKRLSALWNYPKYSSPSRHGAYYYFSRNDGLQNQSIIYRQKGLDGKPELFFDPNKLAADGTGALGSFEFSKNDKYVAYSVAMSGSDWREAFVMDATTGRKLDDHIQWIKFSGLTWKGDDGFYYSRYPEPKEGEVLKGKNEFHQVWYHKVGTAQSDDVLIMKDEKHPLRVIGAGITEDNHYLFIRLSEGSAGGEWWVRDLKDPAWSTFKMMIPGFNTNATVIDNDSDQILVLTNDDAPNYKVVLIDPRHPARENWKTIIPEKEEVLNGVGSGGGYLFASYLKDASTRVYQYSYGGKLLHEIELPGIGTAGGFGGKKTDKEFFYTYSSFSVPSTIYRYNIGAGKSTVFRKTEVKFDADQFETRQVFFESKDGTRIPIFLTYKKGLKLDGNNPVLLYGYGGFNINMTPGFSVSNTFFVEQGGIYAMVNLRGGGEYGEKWHKAGMLENKQNVFDDFIGAAEFLIREKYTNSSKLAIRGGSNGGLLVGAAMTQRPELFKVAVPQVGVMDMLRYHKFTIGWAWVQEYGSSDNAEQFKYLYKYSPLHNLKPGTQYPATIVTTADHDDRVVPAHSFKFAATLQADNAGTNPTIIRIESKAGHGAGKPTSKAIDEAADIWSFTMYNLGMPFRDGNTIIPANAETKKAF